LSTVASISAGALVMADEVFVNHPGA